jgi:O-antigen ligase
MSHLIKRRANISRPLDFNMGILVGVLILAVVGVIVAIPTPFNSGFFTVPLGLAALLAYPILLPLGIVASVPVQDAIPIPEGVPVTVTRAATAAAVALLPLFLIRDRLPLAWSNFLLLVLLVMAVMTLSLWNADSLTAGYAELYRWLVAGFAFWLILQFVRTRQHVLAAVVLIGTLAIAKGGVGIAQSLLGIGPTSFEIGAGFSRAYGSFGMPNSYAAYMEMVTIPLVPLAIWAVTHFWERLSSYRTSRRQGYVASVSERRHMFVALAVMLILFSAVLVGLAGIALSFSRGGWVGTIAALAIMIVLLGRRVLLGSTILAIVFALALSIGASGEILSVIEERFTQLVQQAQIGDIRGVPITSDNFATVERMAHWQTAIAMWDSHPWLGVGVGNFDERFTEYAVHPRFTESQGHAHNYYLHLLAETGIFGLAAYLTFLAGAIVVSSQAYRSHDHFVSAIGVGAIGLTVALTMHNFFENLHVLNISVQMMFVWALALIASRWEMNRNTQANGPNDDPQMLYDSREVSASPHGSFTQSSEQVRL